jgi:hypothetical protein
MYTHFGLGFVESGQVSPKFRELMARLSRKNGWFVPVGPLLDYLGQKKRGQLEISRTDRTRLERRWLWEKMFRGTS